MVQTNLTCNLESDAVLRVVIMANLVRLVHVVRVCGGQLEPNVPWFDIELDSESVLPAHRRGPFEALVAVDIFQRLADSDAGEEAEEVIDVDHEGRSVELHRPPDQG